MATVTEKLTDPPACHALPEQIDGVPVDVRQASAFKRLILTDPEAFADQDRFAPEPRHAWSNHRVSRSCGDIPVTYLESPYG